MTERIPPLHKCGLNILSLVQLSLLCYLYYSDVVFFSDDIQPILVNVRILITKCQKSYMGRISCITSWYCIKNCFDIKSKPHQPPYWYPHQHCIHFASVLYLSMKCWWDIASASIPYQYLINILSISHLYYLDIASIYSQFCIYFLLILDQQYTNVRPKSYQ